MEKLSEAAKNEIRKKIALYQREQIHALLETTNVTVSELAITALMERSAFHRMISGRGSDTHVVNFVSLMMISYRFKLPLSHWVPTEYLTATSERYLIPVDKCLYMEAGSDVAPLSVQIMEVVSVYGAIEKKHICEALKDRRIVDMLVKLGRQEPGENASSLSVETAKAVSLRSEDEQQHICKALQDDTSLDIMVELGKLDETRRKHILNAVREMYVRKEVPAE